MFSTELLLIFLVALVVFGPKRLPELATTLGKLFSYLLILKKKASLFLEEQSKELKLWESEQKAKKADERYSSKD